MILKLGMKHQGEELYKVYINHYLGMSLTYFIYPSSQVGIYRAIGPLVKTMADNHTPGCGLYETQEH